MAKVLVAYASRLGGTRGSRRQSASTSCGGAMKRSCDRSRTSATWKGSTRRCWQRRVREPLAAGLESPASTSGRCSTAGLQGLVGNLKVAGPLADPKDVAELRERLQPRDHQIFWGSLNRAALDKSNLGAFSRFIGRKFIPEVTGATGRPSTRGLTRSRGCWAGRRPSPPERGQAERRRASPTLAPMSLRRFASGHRAARDGGGRRRPAAVRRAGQRRRRAGRDPTADLHGAGEPRGSNRRRSRPSRPRRPPGRTLAVRSCTATCRTGR